MIFSICFVTANRNIALACVNVLGLFNCLFVTEFTKQNKCRWLFYFIFFLRKDNSKLKHSLVIQWSAWFGFCLFWISCFEIKHWRRLRSFMHVGLFLSKACVPVKTMILFAEFKSFNHKGSRWISIPAPHKYFIWWVWSSLIIRNKAVAIKLRINTYWNLELIHQEKLLNMWKMYKNSQT